MMPDTQPLTLGDLFDLAVRIYRRNAGRCLGIALLFYLPMGLLQWLVLFDVLPPQAWLRVLLAPPVLGFPLSCFGDLYLIGTRQIVLLGLSVLQYLFALPLVVGQLTRISAATYLDRPRADAWTWQWEPEHAVELIQTSLAPMLVNSLGIGTVAMLSAQSVRWYVGPLSLVWPMRQLGLGGQLAFLIGLVVLVLYSCFCLAPQVTVLERRQPWESWQRSWRLVGGAPWRVLLVVALTGGLTCVLATLPALALRSLLVAAGGRALDPLAAEVAAVLVQVGLVVALPLQVAVTTVVYYDLRVRIEGYDLEERAYERWGGRANQVSRRAWW